MIGHDAGTSTFLCVLNGAVVDPTTLAGYVATSATVSIAEAAKTGSWTIRDDGLIEYVRAMGPDTLSPPAGLITIVNGTTFAQSIGDVTDDQKAQALAVVQAFLAPTPKAEPATKPPVVPEISTPEPVAPATNAPVPHVHVEPALSGRGWLIHIESAAGAVFHEIVTDLTLAARHITEWLRAH